MYVHAYSCRNEQTGRIIISIRLTRTQRLGVWPWIGHGVRRVHPAEPQFFGEGRLRKGICSPPHVLCKSGNARASKRVALFPFLQLVCSPVTLFRRKTSSGDSRSKSKPCKTAALFLIVKMGSQMAMASLIPPNYMENKDKHRLPSLHTPYVGLCNEQSMASTPDLTSALNPQLVGICSSRAGAGIGLDIRR